jgi:hypothetical protein
VATNTAVGASALSGSNTAGFNVAIGNSALAANTSGQQNTAVGSQAGLAITTGSNNTAIGRVSMYTNTVTGSDNTGCGLGSLYNLTTGSNNTGIGSNALLSNTTASSNTAVGYQAGYSNTIAGSGVCIGAGAGYTNVGGGGNTFVGASAGNLFTAASGATYNAFFGAGSGSAITSGQKNSIIGGYSGNNGGLDIRTASNYIVLSDGDGNPRGIFDNSGTWLVGKTVDTNTVNGVALRTTGETRFTVSGSSSNTTLAFFRNGSASEVGSITTTGTATSYVTSSDYRLKENIFPMTGALDTVSALKPVTYTWKATGESTQGFIAHELQSIIPDAVVGEKDAVDADGNPVYQGIDTSFLVATLTAAIQELKAEIDSLKAQLNGASA